LAVSSTGKPLNTRPLLGLHRTVDAKRFPQKPGFSPPPRGPGIQAQGIRLGPKFDKIERAFESKRLSTSTNGTPESDAELVLVFDLAGTVEGFNRAVARIEGFEFLAESAEDPIRPDDDFHLIGKDGEPSDRDLSHQLQVTMTNATAAKELVRLFSAWKNGDESAFPRGMGRFKKLFAQLLDVRPWSVEDRIAETGLLDAWRERIEVAGNFVMPVRVEIQLWFRKNAADRSSAESRIRALLAPHSATVISRSVIESIQYHALLIELSVQRVQTLLNMDPGDIELLTADEIMFFSPAEPMSFPAPVEPDAPGMPSGTTSGDPLSADARVALLDGLPLAQHEALIGRVLVDDPHGSAETYPVSSRRHGTSMASIILHGDLSDPAPAAKRPIYVRPILEPHPFYPDVEVVEQDRLLPDLIFEAVQRICRGSYSHPAAAPGVRIINLSIGIASRALVRRMSALGRLIDWLSFEYDLLFVVSAGNHHAIPLEVTPADLSTAAEARVAFTRAFQNSGRLRGVMPPGDSMNALTVGALHADAAGPFPELDTVIEPSEFGEVAVYGAVGPGVGRSIKPDVFAPGGRVLYVRPAASEEGSLVACNPVLTATRAPGIRAAAPGMGGELDRTTFTFGTSNATALVTRSAATVLDRLEAGPDRGDPRFPGSEFFTVLTKALIIHSSNWDDSSESFAARAIIDSDSRRKQLTNFIGFGSHELTRATHGLPNRATLIAGDRIRMEGRHRYEVPLPSSLRAKPGWHRVIVTLSYMAPVSSSMQRYRAVRLTCSTPSEQIVGGKPGAADHHANRRGSVQHEVIESTRAMAFVDGDVLSLDIEAFKVAGTAGSNAEIKYGLVVTIESGAETSTTIHEEVRQALRSRVSTTAHSKVRT
jgi:hypothetical protein